MARLSAMLTRLDRQGEGEETGRTSVVRTENLLLYEDEIRSVERPAPSAAGKDAGLRGVVPGRSGEERGAAPKEPRITNRRPYHPYMLAALRPALLQVDLFPV